MVGGWRERDPPGLLVSDTSPNWPHWVALLTDTARSSPVELQTKLHRRIKLKSTLNAMKVYVGKVRACPLRACVDLKARSKGRNIASTLPTAALKSISGRVHFVGCCDPYTRELVI